MRWTMILAVAVALSGPACALAPGNDLDTAGQVPAPGGAAGTPDSSVADAVSGTGDSSVDGASDLPEPGDAAQASDAMSDTGDATDTSPAVANSKCGSFGDAVGAPSSADFGDATDDSGPDAGSTVAADGSDSAYGAGPGVGAPCSSVADCEDGLVCTVDGTDTCTVPWGIGAPCVADAECGENVCVPLANGAWSPYCDPFVLACEPKPDYGACSVGGLCADGHACHFRSSECFGECMTSGVEGGPCIGYSPWDTGCFDNELVCNHALAPGGLCVKPGPAGTSCSEAAHCAAGLACTSVGDVAICRTPSDLGGPCVVSTDCASGLQCDRPSDCQVGVCRVPAPAGAPCASPYACGEGLTCLPGPGGSVCALGDKPCEGTWCPEHFVCEVRAGIGWCTALATPCEGTCPLGYECWTGPAGVDGSCDVWQTYCQELDSVTYPCDESCSGYCHDNVDCELWLDHVNDVVCSQCSPEPWTRLEGAPCQSAEDCASSLTCWEGRCVATELGAECDLTGWKPPCSNDQKCEAGTCKPALEVGASCTDASDCTAGSVCRAPGPSCLPPLEEGEPCAPDECEHGLTCNSEGVCAPPAQYLEPCVTSADCQSGYYLEYYRGYECNYSVCTYQGADYGYCAQNYWCTSSKCAPEGYCAPSCETDADCADGFRCRGPESSRCMLPVPSGEPCKEDHDCATDKCAGAAQCNLGTCE